MSRIRLVRSRILLDVGHLFGTEFVVEDDQFDVVLLDVQAQLLELAGSYVCARVGIIEALRETSDGLGSGRIGQERKLVEIFIGLALVLQSCDKTHKDRAFAHFFSLL